MGRRRSGELKPLILFVVRAWDRAGPRLSITTFGTWSDLDAAFDYAEELMEQPLFELRRGYYELPFVALTVIDAPVDQREAILNTLEFTEQFNFKSGTWFFDADKFNYTFLSADPSFEGRSMQDVLKLVPERFRKNRG